MKTVKEISALVFYPKLIFTFVRAAFIMRAVREDEFKRSALRYFPENEFPAPTAHLKEYVRIIKRLREEECTFMKQ